MLGAFAKTAGGDGGGGGAGGDVGAFIATFVAAVEQIRWSLNETNRCLDGAVSALPITCRSVPFTCCVFFTQNNSKYQVK